MIFAALREIEKELGYIPSYKTFINQMVTDERLANIENEILDLLRGHNLVGYSPNIRVVVNALLSEKNINEVKIELTSKIKKITLI